MSTQIKYTVTTDGITLFHHGKTYPILNSSPAYKLVERALELNKTGEFTAEDVIKASKYEGVADWINSYAGVNDINTNPIKFENGVFFFNDKPLPKTICDRIKEVAKEGNDPTPILKFCERFMQNPSQRSIDQLWSFLDRGGIPFDTDGCFLAYKAVKEDLKDCYTGTIDNSVGKVIKMDRSLVNDDPNAHCHTGLHVGALDYVREFGPRILIVKVDPKNVVSVPNDYNCMKMRVCEYTVIGYYANKLNDTIQPTKKVSLPSSLNNNPSIAVGEPAPDEFVLGVEHYATLSLKDLFELDNDLLVQVAEYYDIIGMNEASKAAIIMMINDIRTNYPK